MNDNFDSEKIISHWIESANSDYKTMLDLYTTRNNSWALFIGHLVIEKLLKALFVKANNTFPPMIHDLRRLCEKSNVELDIEQKLLLDSISRFNINARYDDYKQSFNKLCTDNFTEEWIKKIEDCTLWIKTMLYE